MPKYHVDLYIDADSEEDARAVINSVEGLIRKKAPVETGAIEEEFEGFEGQDRESYSDIQDRKNYN